MIALAGLLHRLAGGKRGAGERPFSLFAAVSVLGDLTSNRTSATAGAHRAIKAVALDAGYPCG
jgi:hypothetical protein